MLCKSQFSKDFFQNWLKQSSHKILWMNLLAKAIYCYLLPFEVWVGGGSFNRDPKNCLGNAIFTKIVYSIENYVDK